MKSKSVFLTLCAALISVSLASCGGGNMGANDQTGDSSASNSADSTNRAEASSPAAQSPDSDVLPGSDAPEARGDMNMRMQSFDEDVENIRQ